MKKINEEEKNTIYSLNIFGPIDKDYAKEFEKIQNSFPEYIKYKGCIPSNESVNVLKDYYLLLFPTRFYTEGIPGTIIDALAAGVPVVAANWENCGEILLNDYNSYIYEFENIKAFEEILKYTENVDNVIKLKKNALESYKKFDKEVAIKVLTDFIDNKSNAK